MEIEKEGRFHFCYSHAAKAGENSTPNLVHVDDATRTYTNQGIKIFISYITEVSGGEYLERSLSCVLIVVLFQNRARISVPMMGEDFHQVLKEEEARISYQLTRCREEGALKFQSC